MAQHDSQRVILVIISFLFFCLLLVTLYVHYQAFKDCKSIKQMNIEGLDLRCKFIKNELIGDKYFFIGEPTMPNEKVITDLDKIAWRRLL